MGNKPFAIPQAWGYLLMIWARIVGLFAAAYPNQELSVVIWTGNDGELGVSSSYLRPSFPFFSILNLPFRALLSFPQPRSLLAALVLTYLPAT